MKQFKGTKGKWEVSEIALGHWKYWTVHHEASDLKVESICSTSLKNSYPEEAKANAQLIAAAPELLEELIDAVDTLKTIANVAPNILGKVNVELINNAALKHEKAINKALGE